MLTASWMTLCLVLAPAQATIEVPKTGSPQWQGVNRDNKSLEKGLFANWPAAGPKVAWENLEIGIGYGSPAVYQGKVYILGSNSNDTNAPEHLLCLDAQSGKQVWKAELKTPPGKFLNGWGGGTRSTPTVAGDYVYVLGVTGNLVCFKKADGSVAWTKNLVTDFGGAIPVWGYSESPLVDGGHVIVTAGKKGSLVALNASNGETVWTENECTDTAGYSSVIPTMVGKVRVYLQQTMNSFIGVNASTGKLLFKTGNPGRRTAVIPTPVVVDDHVFLTAGYGFGCECYKLSAEGDGVKATEVFGKNKTFANHHGGVVAVGNFVYGHSDASGWTCLPIKEANPIAAWQYSKFAKGSILYADGHLLCYSENDGKLAVIKATTDGWKEVGTMTLPKRSPTDKKSGKIWAHPVIADGKLYLRDFDYLFCFELQPSA